MEMEDNTRKQNLGKDSIKINETKKSTNKIISANNHILRKRTPFRFPKKKNDIYVNNKTNFKAHLKLCEKLLESDVKEIIIHGLGKAINQACNLALRLQEIHHGTLELDIKTSSVNLIDDLEPKNDDEDYEINKRQNSAIHIRIFPIAVIGSLRFKN